MKTFLRFFAADNPGGGVEAGVSPATDPAAADTAAPTVLDYKALLLQLLDLTPEADDAAVQAAFAQEEAEPEDDIPALKAQAASATDLQTQLEAANVRIQEFEAAAAQEQQEEIDELIAEAGELPDEAKAALRNALTSDRAGGMALLGAMKKPEPAPANAADTAAATAAPAAPKHDPGAENTTEITPAQKVSDGNALIKTIQGEGKFNDYEAARAEARRRKPALFN